MLKHPYLNPFISPMLLRWPLWLLVVVAIITLPACKQEEEMPEERAVLEQIQSVSRLTLSEVRLSQTYILSGSGIEFKNIRSPEQLFTYLDDLLRYGDRKGVYRCSAYASASIDLSRLTCNGVEETDDGQRITLQLPPITVRMEGVKPTIEVLHERQTGSKKPITPDERNRLQTQSIREMQEEIKPGTDTYNDLIWHAEERVVGYISSLFFMRGYHQVTFRFSDQREVTLTHSSQPVLPEKSVPTVKVPKS